MFESLPEYLDLELNLRDYQFASVVPVKVCSQCGAIVGNMSSHNNWHVKQKVGF
jgi:hypothetical protein